MNPRFFCWIVPHAAPPSLGGIETHAYHVAEELAARGHRVTLFVPDVQGPDAFWQPTRLPELRPLQKPGGAAVVRLRYYRGAERGFARACTLLPERLGVHFRLWLGRRAHRRFERVLVGLGWEVRPDAIVALPHLLPNVTAAQQAAAALGVPFVYLPCLHEEDPHWNAAAVSVFARAARAIIALTAHEAWRLTHAYGVVPDVVHVAGHGVTLPAAISPPPATDSPEILFIGRLTRQKGITSLLEAMTHAWMIAPRLRLHLLGANHPDVPELRRLAGELSGERAAQVRFSVDASDGQKQTALDAAAALVLPSKIESFGGVLIEAGAHARAAVAWDLPVFREIIADGEDGRLVPVDDVPVLGATLARLAGDRAACIALGLAARRKVERRFQWSSVAAVYEEAIRQAISSVGLASSEAAA